MRRRLYWLAWTSYTESYCMGSGLMAVDRELQTAVVKKEIFLPLQDSWKNPRAARRVKAWYDLALVQVHKTEVRWANTKFWLLIHESFGSFNFIRLCSTMTHDKKNKQKKEKQTKKKNKCDHKTTQVARFSGNCCPTVKESVLLGEDFTYLLRGRWCGHNSLEEG